MRRFIYILYKDVLMILRDPAGAALMFFMPLLLVMIMTIIQDRTFESVNESDFDLILLNEDKGIVGNTIENKLIEYKIFNASTTIDEKNLTRKTLKEVVANGDYKVGIIIPENTSKEILLRVKRMVAYAFAPYSGKEISYEPVNLIIYVDPAIKSSYKSLILSSLKENTQQIENQIIVDEILSEVNKRIPGKEIEFNITEMVGYDEQYAISKESSIIPNSVQHNVPAWTLFAMFFIVISLSSNMVKEKSEGSYTRLRAIAFNHFGIIAGKIVVYLFICIIQLISMMLMGVYILPLFGLNSLDVGNNLAGLALIGICTALGAIGYSILVGTLAKSHHQAASFGSVSVVILSAIGGVWVPVFAMPSFMQKISIISPLNWGIDGFYEVFIRDGNILEVLKPSLFLTVFFLVCIIISFQVNRLKQYKGGI